MMILVVGTPNSGKSALAERIAMEREGTARYYLATMKVCDEGGRRRVAKHRKAREGKGFVTLEIPYGVDRALEEIKNPEEAVVLLECMSNLVGNEMHDNPARTALCHRAATASGLQDPTGYSCSESPDADIFIRQILGDLTCLAEGVKDLIIVTNAYEADPSYDEETMQYIALCNGLNEKLREMADVIHDVREENNP